MNDNHAEKETERYRTPAKVRLETLDFSEQTAAQVIDYLHGGGLTQGALFLGHALDGVIWGRVDESGHLLTTIVRNGHPFQNERLDSRTLLQARLFTPKTEIYFYKTDDVWQERFISDVPADDDKEAFDEWHILWGTSSEPLPNKFTLLTHGAQGMRHAIPKEAVIIEPNEDDEQPEIERVFLKVRHYLDEMDSGVNYIAMSRLVEIEVKNVKKSTSAL